MGSLMLLRTLNVLLLIAAPAAGAIPHVELLRNRTTPAPLLAASHQGLPAELAKQASSASRPATVGWLLAAHPQAPAELARLYREQGVAAAGRSAPATRDLVTGALRQLVPPAELAKYRAPGADAARQVEQFCACLEAQSGRLEEASAGAPKVVALWSPVSGLQANGRQAMLLERAGARLPREVVLGKARLPIDYPAELAGGWGVETRREDQELLALAGECFAELRGEVSLNQGRLSITPTALVLRSSSDPAIELLHWKYGALVGGDRRSASAEAPQGRTRGRRPTGEVDGGGAGRRSARGSGRTMRGAAAATQTAVAWRRATPISLNAASSRAPAAPYALEVGCGYLYFTRMGRGAAFDERRDGFNGDFWALRNERYAPTVGAAAADAPDWL